MKRRIFSVLLAIMMVCTTVDMTAFAKQAENTTIVDIDEEETEEESVSENESIVETTEEMSTEESVTETETSTETAVETEEVTTEEVTEEETTEVDAEEDVALEEILEPSAAVENGTMTRIEWLQTLIDTFDMVVEEDNYPDNYYSDIDSTYEFYRDVMVATEFGLIDVEAGDPLEPNALVTREFAAHSLNVCLAYGPENDSYSFAESATVKWPDDIQVSIDRGWFTLVDGKFNPEQTVTDVEVSMMISDAEKAIEAVAIDPDHVNTYEFKENVIVLPQDVDVHLTGEKEITIYDCAQELKAGDIFAIVSDGFPAVKKVKSIEVVGNATIIQTDSVETEEAFKNLDIQGTVDVDLKNVRSTDDNVTFNYIVGGSEEQKYEDGAKYSSLDEVGNRTVDAIEIVQTYAISKEISEKFELPDGVEVVITGKVYNVKATYDSTNSSAYFKVDADTMIDCNVSMDVIDAMGINLSEPILEIPIQHIAWFRLYLEMTFGGELNLHLDEHISVGVYYNHNSGFRFEKNFQKKSFTITADIEASLGLKASIEVDWCVIEGYLSARVGVAAHVKSEVFTDGQKPLNCSQVNAWVYASVGCGVEVNLIIYKDSWKHDIPIYTMYNSPIKISDHYEDGKYVDECTRDAKEESGQKKYKYYTPADSKYRFAPISKGKGANGTTVTLFDYTLDSSNLATITKYYGNASAVCIPEKMDGYTVVGIANSAFKDNTSLKSVVIPDTVTTIGTFAFMDCVNLRSVILSKSLKRIEYGAFQNCDSLTSIEIPKSLDVATHTTKTYGVFAECDNLKKVTFEEGTTQIAKDLFALCSSLEEITIPDTVTRIEEYAFYRCTNLREIEIPDSVTEIGGYAFQGCSKIKTVDFSNSVKTLGSAAFNECNSLEEIVLPDSVIKIDTYAFMDCIELSKVKLSKNLKSIEYGAFQNCDALTEIEIPKSLDVATHTTKTYGVFAECDNLKKVTFEEGTTQIAEDLFALCSSLEEITIPDTVTRIEKYAFYCCTNLKEIKIPDSVTTIDDYSFMGCNKIKNVTFSNRVKSLGQSSFAECSFLEEVVLPSSITAIDEYAFMDCISLRKVELSKNLKSIKYGAFQNCDALTSIEIPKSLDVATKSVNTYGVFAECENLKKVTFEEGTTQIPECLFALCPGIEELDIPNTVTNIEQYAFYKCTGMNKITIPSSVETIAPYAFMGCSALETVVLSEGLKNINNFAFKDCSALKEVTLPNSVKTVGTELFSGCTYLEKAVLPNTVTTITDDMFKNCANLKEIAIPSTVTTISEYAFYGNKKLAKVTGGENVSVIEKYAFYDCDALESITISDKCKSFGEYIFADCEVLTDVKIGTGITEIPKYAFNNCSTLTKVELPYGVTTVYAKAFANCPKLAEITIPRATTSIAADAFSYPGNMTIYGVAGTYAETYANDNMITFVEREVNATDVSLESEVTVNKGATKRLVLSVTPSNFTDAVKWKSADTSIVTVDNTGVVKGVGLGTAKVVVSVGGIAKNCMVTVVQPVTSVNINKSSISIDGGTTYKLTASVSPSTANDKRIEWSSSDETIATVSQEGLVTAVGKGSAVIKVVALDGSGKSDTCTVNVVSAVYNALTVDEMQSSHPYEDNCKDSWIYTVKDANSLEVFFSEDTNVEEDFDYIYIYTGSGTQVGKYTGTALANKKVEVKGDTVRVQLVSDDANGAYGFRVTEIREKMPVIALKGITLDKTGVEMLVGDTERLTINYNPVNATKDEEPTWNSSDEKVATVSNGVVTAIGKGTATITATVKGKSAKCTIIVKQPIEDIALTPSELELHEGEVAYIQVSALPFGTKPSGTIQWSDYSDEIITLKVLHSEGKAEIKALQQGTTQIHVSVDGIEKNCTIAVVPSVITLNYGDGTLASTIEAVVGELITNLPQAPERENFIFGGWYTEADGKGELVTKDSVLTNQWNLYAYWIPVKEGMWVNPVGDQEYTGKAIKPVVEVYDGMTKLVLGQDYTVSYKNNKVVASESDTKAPTIIVKGKGLYKGTAQVKFNIVPKSIEGSDVVIESVYKAVNNKVQNLVPTVKWGKTKLKKNKDFVVTYPERQEGAYKDAGQYEVLITGIGNYEGTRKVWQVLSEKEKVLMSKVSVKKIADVKWSGRALCPEPEVTYKKVPLTKGEHYELEYENNTEIGTATIKIVGKGMYSGVKKVTFKITGLNLAKAKMSTIEPCEYSGQAYEPHPTLTLGDEVLVEGNDYVVSYNKNVNAGKAQILFSGIGRCKGTLKKTFTIKKYDITGHSVEEQDIACEYLKGGSRPEVTLVIGGNELVAGKDYKISYAKNNAVSDGTNPSKQPTITIKGAGNYTGKITEVFRITPKNIQDVVISAQDVVVPTKKNKWQSKPILTDSNGKKLSAGTDYEKTFVYTYAEEATMLDGTTRSKDSIVSAEDIPAVDTKIKITVKGIKNYKESTEVIYSIVPASIAKAKVTIPNQTYTGKKITISKDDIVVKVGGKEIEKEDFEIVEDSYVNNIKTGKASVTIRGTRNYGGTKVVTFKIVPKSVVWRILGEIMN